MHRFAALATAPLAALTIAGCGSSSSSGGDYCASARALQTDGAALSAISGNPTIDQIKAAFGPFTRDLDALDNAASSDITGDTHKMRQAFDSVNAAIQKATSVAAAGDAVSTYVSSSSAISSSGKKVDDYTKGKCGFTISTNSSSGSTGTSSTTSSSASSTDTGSASSTDTGSASSTDTSSPSSSASSSASST